MLETWETDDPLDARLATGATGLLRTFNEAGVLTAADVHVAARTADLVGEPSEEVRLAVAMAVRAVRLGSVCVDLAALAADAPGLPWPGGDWLALVAGSPMAARSPLIRATSGVPDSRCRSLAPSSRPFRIQSSSDMAASTISSLEPAS